jgi:c-di-GMP-binding flagellar brake protein YcgR
LTLKDLQYKIKNKGEIMVEGKMFIEKRQHKRIEKQFKVNYKLIPDSREVESIKKQGQSYDISVGGIRVIGSPVGKEGDIIRVEIIINESTTPIVSFAEIRWIKETDKDSQFGIKFLMLKDNDSKISENMINE